MYIYYKYILVQGRLNVLTYYIISAQKETGILEKWQFNF